MNPKGAKSAEGKSVKALDAQALACVAVAAEIAVAVTIIENECIAWSFHKETKRKIPMVTHPEDGAPSLCWIEDSGYNSFLRLSPDCAVALIDMYDK